MTRRRLAIIIAALLLAAMQTPLGSTMIAVALPAIGSALASDLSLTTGLLVTSYIVVNMILQTPAGALADAIGRWRVLEMGMALFALGALLAALATQLWIAAAGRILMGAGGALMSPATLAILNGLAPPEHRGKLMGVYSAVIGLSAAIGPPLGGELVHHFGWRSIFIFSLPLLALAMAVARFARPPQTEDMAPRGFGETLRQFDWLGSALLGGAFAAMSFGSWTSFALAIALAIAFAAWEARAPHPVLAPRLFRKPVFAAACAIIMLQSFMMYGIMFQLPQFFDALRGAGARETGYLLLAMMLGLFVASVAGGALSDRFGARNTALAGAVLILASLVWFLRLADFQTPRDAWGAAILAGIGLGISWPTVQAAAMGAADSDDSGMAAGATATARYLGAALGVMALSILSSGTREQLLDAHLTLLWLFAGAVALSGLACGALPAALPRRKK